MRIVPFTVITTYYLGLSLTHSKFYLRISHTGLNLKLVTFHLLLLLDLGMFNVHVKSE